jgi:cyclopropane fatty-acyl-phospholipid synthase-like methyltransferase
MERANFDGIARAYRWMEYATFGIILERCRLYHVKYARNARRVLVFGDGDGRFVARMLKGNPDLNADAVDFSEQMLKLLRERSEREGAGGRVHTHLADARELEGPGGTYDLLVTHFFLDCLTEEECRTLLRKVRPHLTADANWLISEFAIPRNGWRKIAGTLLVSALYTGFRWMTNLKIRKLPDYAAIAREFRFVLQERKTFLCGLLVAEVWRV